MVIVGFNFTKINAERKKPLQGKIQIQNNVGIINVEEYRLNIGKSTESGVKFLFKYDTIYSSDIGSISLEGEILFLEEQKKVKDILARWKKEKKVDQPIMIQIMNTILMKANIQALNISQDLGLPAPLQLPKVNVKQPEKK